VCSTLSLHTCSHGSETWTHPALSETESQQREHYPSPPLLACNTLFITTMTIHLPSGRRLRITLITSQSLTHYSCINVEGHYRMCNLLCRSWYNHFNKVLVLVNEFGVDSSAWNSKWFLEHGINWILAANANYNKISHYTRSEFCSALQFLSQQKQCIFTHCHHTLKHDISKEDRATTTITTILWLSWFCPELPG